MPKTTQMRHLAAKVTSELNKYFTEAEVLTASADAKKVYPADFWRLRATGVLFDEKAMLAFMTDSKRNANFARDYRIAKLARQRGLI